MPLEQHHAQRRVPVGRRRRKRHRVGVVGLAGARFGEPAVEQGKGIVAHRRGHNAPRVRGRAGYRELDRSPARSEEHTSELQSLMRTSYAVFCLKKKKRNTISKYTIVMYKP